MIYDIDVVENGLAYGVTFEYPLHALTPQIFYIVHQNCSNREVIIYPLSNNEV